MSLFFFDEICSAVEKADKHAFSKHKCQKCHRDTLLCECFCKCHYCTKQHCFKFEKPRYY